MKRILNLLFVIMHATIFNGQGLTDNNSNSTSQDNSNLLIRIAEIEVFPEYLSDYLEFAKSVGAESVAKEEGVICIFPMVQKGDSSQIRILEIYRDIDTYQSRLNTPHFQRYKQGTLHMVKSLLLNDMRAIDAGGMRGIFRKGKE